MGIEKYFDLSGKVALITGAASVPKVSYEKVLSQIGAPSNLIKAAREWERKYSYKFRFSIC